MYYRYILQKIQQTDCPVLLMQAHLPLQTRRQTLWQSLQLFASVVNQSRHRGQDFWFQRFWIWHWIWYLAEGVRRQVCKSLTNVLWAVWADVRAQELCGPPGCPRWTWWTEFFSKVCCELTWRTEIWGSLCNKVLKMFS